MKVVLKITALLLVLALAVIGCMAILEVLTVSEAKVLLFKAWASLLLLGLAALVISLLTANKTPRD